MPQKAMGSLLGEAGARSAAGGGGGGSAGGIVGRYDSRSSHGPAGVSDVRPTDAGGRWGNLFTITTSQETWREWIGQGTKVINELRLDFSNEAHQQVYEQQMKEWLEITDEEVAAYKGKP